MRYLVSWLVVAMALTAGSVAAQECPQCKPIDDWLAQNSRACGYHGNRLPSICQNDPECVQWNRACKAKRDARAACITRCMAGPSGPAGPARSEAPELDEFDRDMADLERTGYSPNHIGRSREWCEERRRNLAARARQEMRTRSDANLKLFDQGYIGFTLARIGTAHVHRCAGLSGGIVEGTAIRIGDCIQTGPKGGVRLQMLDRDDFRGAGPTRIVIGPNSELCFNKFLFHFGDSGKLEHKNLVDLVLGSVKVFFKGWGRNSTVSIKTGATICGVRGSEVIVRRERTDGAVQVGVIEGHAWLGNRTTRQIRYLKAGNWAQDQATGLSQVSPMSRADWNRVVQKDGLGLGGAISGSGAACERILGRWKWSNGNVFVFSADHRWNRPGTQFRGNWRCQTNRQGQSEVRITPDQGSRWTVVRIAPDGLNMSGIGDNGRPARAMRLLP